MNRKIGFLMAWLGLSPIVTWADANTAHALMNGAMRSLAVAGLAISEEAQAAVQEQVPTPQAKPADDKVDVKTLLKALVTESKKESAKLIPEVAKELGIGAVGSTFTVTMIPFQKTTDATRWVLVVTTPTETNILIEEYIKAKNSARSYLVNPEGELLAVIDTRRKDAKTFESHKVSFDKSEDRKAIEADLEKLLDFWRQYYRENLKNKEGKDKPLSSSPNSGKK